ncbi:YIP1 family protein [candidate division KSB1 bacterium]|nr:YIP1 family protein [candidate division KSB1 bacterium]
MELSNSPVGAAVVAQAKGPFERLIGVFVSPASTMQDIAARPSWVLPLIIVTIVGSVSAFFLKGVILQTQLEAMEKRNMTAEQIEQARPMMEKMMTYTVPLVPLVTTPLFYLVIAGLLMFTGNVILGGEAKFSQLFAVTCWSGTITALSSIINVPIMVNKGVMESATSLSSLLPSEENKTLLYNLFSQIDLFWIWWVAVIGFGVAAVYKFSTRKAMTTVFAMWVIYVVIAVAIKSIFS